MDNKLRVLSLFSGIGAFEKALTNLGVNYELINYCENWDIASKAYSIIHNVSENLNLGDINNIEIEKLKEFDLLTHGSPCQSFSSCGKEEGGDEGSGTQSSLMWNTVEIIKNKKPKYVIWENVKNVLSKKHRHNFDKYIDKLNELGYTNYWKVLNSKDFGTPMNRERIFVVSILGEHEPYEFPSLETHNLNLKDYLEKGLSDDNVKVAENVKPGCKKEFLKHYDKIISCENDTYDCRAKSDFQDKKVGIRISYCIRANSTNTHILDNKTIRKLTPLEFWRLMNFSDEDYLKVKEHIPSKTHLCKLAGNSIDVVIMEQIFKKLLL